MHWSDFLTLSLFWVTFVCIIYVYAGYGVLLRFLSILFAPRTHERQSINECDLPQVTVLLTAFNEEAKLAKRLDNLLGQVYPKNRFRIVVASDGSTDATDRIVADYAEKTGTVRLVASGGRLGKSGTQNLAMQDITDEIVVLTDSDTEFDHDYLRHIGAAFIDPQVGCVTANLEFRAVDGSISSSQGYYWNYEIRIRSLESELGILAVASGQAMAFRRKLFRELPVNVGDDCIIPLDVVSAGAKTRFVEDAHAWDVMEHEPRREFNTRVRMTLRNWVGTWLHPQLLNPARNPGYAFSLWSHKLLRWLSGPLLFTLCGLGLYNGLAIEGHGFMFVAVVLFFCATLAGWYLEGRPHAVPVVGSIFSFVLANLGFSIGLWKALSGDSVVTYQSGESITKK